MLHFYFDTSALVKRYTPEVGSALVNEIFQHVALENIACSMLAVPEIISILVRKRNDKRLINNAYQQALLNFDAEIVGNSRVRKVSVLDLFVITSIPFIHKHNINASDAIILRSALDLQQLLHESGDTLLFCAADKRLIRAAQAEGITAFNPKKTQLSICANCSNSMKAAMTYDISPLQPDMALAM